MVCMNVMRGTMQIDVRRMSEADIHTAVSLTDTEDWGFVRRDFQRFLELEPEGCLLAEVDGQVVGVSFVIRYENFLE